MVVIILAFVLLISATQSISFYFESLWFSSLGFDSVYWYRIKAQALAFTAFFFATTIVLWLMFRIVIPASSGPRRPLMEFNGQIVYMPGRYDP